MTENAMVRASDINVDDIGRIGKMLAMSGYFDSANNFEVAVAQMATKVMAGREMGFGPFASANGIHIIKGKPGVGANLMASAVKSHPRYNYRVREMTAQACRIEFFERADSGEWESIGVSEFTEADARAAGTQNMQKYARNMLFARAMSNGVRWFCPDVFNGNAVYVPEELGATVDDDGNMVEAKYTVHQPQPAQMQNGNGNAAANMPERMSVAEYNAHNLLHGDPDVDFSDIPEDTAGAMATPVSGGSKPKASEKDIKLLNAMGKAALYNDWNKKHEEICTKLGIDSTKDMAADDAQTAIAWLRTLLVKNLSAGLIGVYGDADDAKADFIEQVTEWTDKQGNVRKGVRTLDDATDWNLVFLTDNLAKMTAEAA